MNSRRGRSGERLRSLDEVETVVDADSHLTENIDDVLPYMDDRYAGIKEIIELSPRPLNEIFSYAQPTPAQPYQQAEGTAVFEGEGGPDAKLAQMDDYGIDYSVIDPTLSGEINTLNNSRMAVAWANAYNSFVLDKFGDHDESFKVTMIVAPQRPEEAAEEIDRRADEKDIVGVHLPPAGLVPPAGHSRYDPIFDAAQAADLPVIFHTYTGATHLNFPVQHRWNETYATEHAVVHPFTHSWNMTSMLFEGVPARFPDLDVIHQEAGIGWIPYMVYRLDDHYLENAHEIPGLDKLPSEYIKDQYYFTTQPLGHTAERGQHIAWFIDMIGPDSVMYSADIPHPDFDPPEELFDRITSHFDAETVRDVMGRNAIEAYDLSV